MSGAAAGSPREPIPQALLPRAGLDSCLWFCQYSSWHHAREARVLSTVSQPRVRVIPRRAAVCDGRGVAGASPAANGAMARPQRGAAPLTRHATARIGSQYAAQRCLAGVTGGPGAVQRVTLPAAQAGCPGCPWQARHRARLCGAGDLCAPPQG